MRNLLSIDEQRENIDEFTTFKNKCNIEYKYDSQQNCSTHKKIIASITVTYKDDTYSYNNRVEIMLNCSSNYSEISILWANAGVSNYHELNLQDSYSSEYIKMNYNIKKNQLELSGHDNNIECIEIEIF